MSEALANLLTEERVFPPSDAFTAQANAQPGIYEAADADYLAFWEKQARERISWFTEPTVVLDDSNPPFYKWFSDGELNLSYNCLDRHLETQGDKVAYHWVGEPGDTRPGKPFDKFPANTGAGAPDLSLMAKARAGFHGPYGLGINQLINGTGGAEYIYSVLTGYTGEEVEEAGAILYENTAFAGGKISMAPPLDEGLVEYVMHGGEEGHGDTHAPEATVEQMAEDVSAFLMWAAEPQMTERKQSGFRNIVWLAGLTVLLYFTNKALWAKVKRKE